jgi:decaprenylphospho-beta-D-ribofuranose 2-oxidase
MPDQVGNHRFRALHNFGHSLIATSHVVQATSAEEISAALDLARGLGLTLTVRGGGRSYNDAALNAGHIVLDLSGMNRILAWDPATGLLKCEPGVTLEQVWQRVEPDGWWPAVVSGTMRTTVGGCLAANIHGKNNFRRGPIGEHVTGFRAMLADGTEISCSREQNADLFRSMIGGFGLLGIFTSADVQMKPVESGLLVVDAWPVRSLANHLGDLYEHAPNFDYIVGWLDTTASGQGMGRGQIHAARYLAAAADPDPLHSRLLENGST